MKKSLILFFAFSLLLTLVCGLSAIYAEIPRYIHYQGRLTKKESGKPVDDQTYKFIFKIYDSDSVTAIPIWIEAPDDILVEKGVFSVELGKKASLNSLAFDRQYYLEVIVNNEIMDKRQRITSVPYAIRAEKTESAESAKTADNAKTADSAKSAERASAIETRTSDPSSPTTGQIWLRTDL